MGISTTRLVPNLITQANMGAGLRVPVVCTSSTRPSAPSHGDIIYETDTTELLEWYSGPSQWRRPWKMPWGRMADAQSNNAAAAFSGNYDLLVCAAFTAVANRWLRITATFPMLVNGANTNVDMHTYAGATLVNSCKMTHPASTNLTMVSFALHSPAAGSIVYKINLNVAGGNINFLAGGTGYLIQMTVEDIGPNGAPA